MSKEEFFNSITANTVADEEFFKKIYGYYFCDKGFAYRVAERLLQLGRKDIIRDYNQ